MKKILVALAIVLVVCVAGLLVTAVDQLVGLASRFHPFAGQVTFWILVSAIAGAALFILFEYYRLPVTLALPADASPDEQRRYLSLLRRRLKRNPRFKQQSLQTIEEIQSALGSLQIEADTLIRRTAATVFISTAAMQNGRLDGVVVLLTQTRMIWQIARLYVQRPSARDLIYLYGNVAGTALLASNLEDIDLSDVFAPGHGFDGARGFLRHPGGGWDFSFYRALRFQWSRQRVSDLADRGSGAALLRGDLAHVAPGNTNRRHRRGCLSFGANRDRKCDRDFHDPQRKHGQAQRGCDSEQLQMALGQGR